MGADFQRDIVEYPPWWCLILLTEDARDTFIERVMSTIRSNMDILKTDWKVFWRFIVNRTVVKLPSVNNVLQRVAV